MPSPQIQFSQKLNALWEATDPRLMVTNDPVSIVRRYEDPHDQEVAGLLVASLAYGRVGMIQKKANAILEVLGPPAEGIRKPKRLKALRGVVYRFQKGDDIPRFLASIATIRDNWGSLGHAFSELTHQEDQDIADPASRFVELLRKTMGEPLTYGLRYLLPDPSTGGAAKRLLLYLRWMIRGPDAADLGTWQVLGAGLSPKDLVLPLDTHVSRIGRYLGLTDRMANDLRTAREMTARLAMVDPSDPVRFDMVLCHLGISGACPTTPIRSNCQRCSLRNHCRGRADGRRSIEVGDGSRR